MKKFTNILEVKTEEFYNTSYVNDCNEDILLINGAVIGFKVEKIENGLRALIFIEGVIKNQIQEVANMEELNQIIDPIFKDVERVDIHDIYGNLYIIDKSFFTMVSKRKENDNRCLVAFSGFKTFVTDSIFNGNKIEDEILHESYTTEIKSINGSITTVNEFSVTFARVSKNENIRLILGLDGTKTQDIILENYQKAKDIFVSIRYASVR